MVVAGPPLADRRARIDPVVADRQLVGGPCRVPGGRSGRRGGQAAAAGGRSGRRKAGIAGRRGAGAPGTPGRRPFRGTRHSGGTRYSGSRAAGYGLRPQSLWRRNAPALVGTGGRWRRFCGSFAQRNARRDGAAVRSARPAGRGADRGFLPGCVPRQDSVDGPGKFHPSGSDTEEIEWRWPHSIKPVCPSELPFSSRVAHASSTTSVAAPFSSSTSD